MFSFESCLEQTVCCQVLTTPELLFLIRRCKEIFFEEANVSQVSSPAFICGDIHGQFHDLLELFATAGGPPPANKFIFLGDFVDRGYHGLETITLLLLYKLRYPEHIYLIRGNHETRAISTQYGFYEEVMSKLGSSEVWSALMSLFDVLPLAATLDNSLFCVHGGLSPSLPTLDSMDTVFRAQEVPQTGAVCDLLWSDPDTAVTDWEESVRGAGYLFGANPTRDFLHRNSLDLICRAHQLVQEGYQYMFDETLVTVWSAPNYCYRCGNLASILHVDSNRQREFKIFEENKSQPTTRHPRHPRSADQYFL